MGEVPAIYKGTARTSVPAGKFQTAAERLAVVRYYRAVADEAVDYDHSVEDAEEEARAARWNEEVDADTLRAEIEEGKCAKWAAANPDLAVNWHEPHDEFSD